MIRCIHRKEVDIMKAIIYDDCPNFILHIDNVVITRKDMTFKQALDYLDEREVPKDEIYIYNKRMERVYL